MKFPEDFINKIINGDCLKILPFIPENTVDLTVTSPPYDKLRDYKGFKFEFKKIADEIFRITKPGGVLVWVIGDSTINGSETGSSFRQALYFKEIGFSFISGFCIFPSVTTPLLCATRVEVRKYTGTSYFSDISNSFIIQSLFSCEEY
ncbi:MAG: DNA methyltransferase [Promethearchaeota archaeon]